MLHHMPAEVEPLASAALQARRTDGFWPAAYASDNGGAA